MIVKCPSCQARFRLDRQKLAGKRLMLRCSKCRSPFRVEMPREDTRPENGGTLVMLAHSDEGLCIMMREILDNAGIQSVMAHNGESVLAQMEATPPQIAVVDVALQGLYAFEVVDKIRQRPGLEQVKIILLSSVYSKTAYKRAPSSLYNADDYIEKHHIPDDLIPKINRLVIDIAPATGRRKAGEMEQPGQAMPEQQYAAQSNFIDAVNARILQAEEQQVDGHLEGSDLDRAGRLARIIVSDIALYCQDQMDEGIRGGNWNELLASEVREARRIFREKFPGEEIQKAKILEKAFLDLLQHRQQELGI